MVLECVWPLDATVVVPLGPSDVTELPLNDAPAYFVVPPTDMLSTYFTAPDEVDSELDKVTPWVWLLDATDAVLAEPDVVALVPVKLGCAYFVVLPVTAVPGVYVIFKYFVVGVKEPEPPSIALTNVSVPLAEAPVDEMLATYGMLSPAVVVEETFVTAAPISTVPLVGVCVVPLTLTPVTVPWLVEYPWSLTHPCVATFAPPVCEPLYPAYRSPLCVYTLLFEYVFLYDACSSAPIKYSFPVAFSDPAVSFVSELLSKAMAE